MMKYRVSAIVPNKKTASVEYHVVFFIIMNYICHAYNFKTMMTKFLSNHFATIAMALLAFLSSCSVLDEVTISNMNKSYSDLYDDILVPASRFPLFADLNVGGTKSYSDSIIDELVTLESLIDRNLMVTKTFKQYYFKEIPFRSNANPSFAVLSRSAGLTMEHEEYSKISLFLVETTDTVSNVIERRVVTMIPDKKYMRNYSGKTMSFINKEAFSGIILFSDIDGQFRDVYVYGGDFCSIIDAKVIDASEKDYSGGYCFLMLVQEVRTRGPGDSENGVILTPSYCIAQDDDHSDCNHPDFWNGEDNLDGDSGTGSGEGGGASSGGSDGGSSGYSPDAGDVDDSDNPNTGNDSEEDLPEEKQKYQVSLYAAEGGRVLGSGYFLDGTLIVCRAMPNQSYIFDRWVGDLKGLDDRATMTLDRDISSTAYFRLLLETSPVRPCLDTLTGKMNPLIEMSLAPSNTWSQNYKGATFGWTRNQDKQFHNGLDLYAEPGTPVYSMYDGVVSEKNYVTNQPMRDSEGNYPIGYIGDKNGAGNRLFIDSTIDGIKVSIGYWHLLVNNPIAINPRTGFPFKPGDVVYQGEIIAYTGKTGNANKIPFNHLHLAVMRENTYINPELYINGSLMSSGNNTQRVVSSTKIINIKCH